MLVASGQIPHEPAVHGSEAQLALLGTLARTWHVIQNPADLCSGEVSVNDQPCFLADQLRHSGRLEGIAVVGCPPVLPYDGVADRLSSLGVPDDGGLALVGYSDRGDVRTAKSQRCHCFRHHGIFGSPDLHRVVLDHPRFREMLCELFLAHGLGFAFPVEDDRS